MATHDKKMKASHDKKMETSHDKKMETIQVCSKDNHKYIIHYKKSKMISDLVDMTDECIVLPFDSSTLSHIIHFHIERDPHKIIKMLHAIDFLDMCDSSLEIYETFSLEGMQKALEITDLYYPRYYLTNVLKVISFMNRKQYNNDDDDGKKYRDVDFLIMLFKLGNIKEEIRTFIVKHLKDSNHLLSELVKNTFLDTSYSFIYSKMKSFGDSKKKGFGGYGYIKYNIKHNLCKMNYDIFRDIMELINDSNFCDELSGSMLFKSYKYDVDEEIIRYICMNSTTELLQLIIYANHTRNIDLLNILKKKEKFKASVTDYDHSRYIFENEVMITKYKNTSYTDVYNVIKWWLVDSTISLSEHNIFKHLLSLENCSGIQFLIDVKKLNNSKYIHHLDNAIYHSFFVPHIGKKCTENCNIMPKGMYNMYSISCNCLCTLDDVPLTIPKNIVRDALYNKSFDTMSWLLKNKRNIDISGDIMDEASVDNRYDILNWLVNSGLTLYYSEKAIDNIKCNKDCYPNCNKWKMLAWWINSELPLKYSNICMHSKGRRCDVYKIKLLEYGFNKNITKYYNRKREIPYTPTCEKQLPKKKKYGFYTCDN